MELRKYEVGTPQYHFYKEQHKTQTYKYVSDKLKQYHDLGNVKIEMSMDRALKAMDSFVDPSDPDTHSENSIHAYQTAERIRKKHPNDRELQICGLIHDLGKVLFIFNEPSLAVVGDTYAVGCKFPESIVYFDTMKENPDFDHPIYSTENGIYEPGCGIENLTLSFGHDEYLYQVLQHNTGHKLSEKYHNIIRFHSFYPWHTGKDYIHFMKPGDEIIMQDVLDFNQFDLYSKTDTDFVLTDEIRSYYENLLNEYFPEPLHW
jgi:inositol oxygenase